MSRLHEVPDPEGAAARWFARFRRDDVAGRDRDRFEAWRDEDPSHREAYATVDGLWEELGDYAAESPIIAMRREALAQSVARPTRGWAPYAAVAAMLLLVASFAFLSLPSYKTAPNGQTILARRDPEPVYRTGVGEHSSIRLADGSTLELNTDTAVRVRFSGRERLVELVRGEAMFNVAKDPNRSFVVEAGGERVTAHGTAFNVRERASGIEITLIEGKVSVARRNASARPLATLLPGQQFVATDAAGGFHVRPADVGAVSSWRYGRVSFDDEPLANVLLEMNRYSDLKLELGRPDLGSLRISGVFRTGSPDSFAAALSATFPVEAESDTGRNRIVLEPRAEAASRSAG
jgi:transmembrane sensor